MNALPDLVKSQETLKHFKNAYDNLQNLLPSFYDVTTLDQMMGVFVDHYIHFMTNYCYFGLLTN